MPMVEKREPQREKERRKCMFTDYKFLPKASTSTKTRTHSINVCELKKRWLYVEKHGKSHGKVNGKSASSVHYIFSSSTFDLWHAATANLKKCLYRYIVSTTNVDVEFSRSKRRVQKPSNSFFRYIDIRTSKATIIIFLVFFSLSTFRCEDSFRHSFKEWTNSPFSATYFQWKRI